MQVPFKFTYNFSVKGLNPGLAGYLSIEIVGAAIRRPGIL
jgi:hypothetical protein